MEFTEFGNKNGKTLMLLPGTACKWQFNFKYVLDELAEKYYQRYLKYFHNPDIHVFDMKHEVWLYDAQWHQPVLDCVCRCMEA